MPDRMTTPPILIQSRRTSADQTRTTSLTLRAIRGARFLMAWACALSVSVLLMLPMQAVAQFISDTVPPEQLEQWLQRMSVQLIYPESIDVGETFVLHAHVHNGNEQSVLVSIGVQQDDADLYVLQRCRNNCGILTIEPGQSRYITVGEMYYADATLQQMPSVTIEPVLAVMPTDSGVSLPTPSRTLDSVSIAVDNPPDLPAPNAALSPVPERQALQVADLREPDDQLLVRDPNTGYDWMRLHATVGLRMEDALHALATEDYLQGFQLARASQVEQLVLNYLHAEGRAAQALSIRAPSADHEFGAPLAEFMRLLAPGISATALAVHGVTADEPGIWGHNLPVVGAASVYGYEGPPQTGTYRRGIGLLTTRHPVVDNEGGAMTMPGFWLVRGAPERQRADDRASYLDDELLVPVLKIGDNLYRAVLANVDSQRGMFRVSSLTELSSTNDAPVTDNAASFDESSGLLMLPDLVLMQADGTESAASATFRLMPETEPPAFELISLEE
ncbi:MAG: hypothetical protein WD071_11560 [Pseudohongiella sp.]|uniref:hypothetical protein n=1 Tax=Pseudohongiella sp. TaxID=1979412 RepID=UPI0034A04978